MLAGTIPVPEAKMYGAIRGADSYTAVSEYSLRMLTNNNGTANSVKWLL